MHIDDDTAQIVRILCESFRGIFLCYSTFSRQIVEWAIGCSVKCFQGELLSFLSLSSWMSQSVVITFFFALLSKLIIEDMTAPTSGMAGKCVEDFRGM